MYNLTQLIMFMPYVYLSMFVSTWICICYEPTTSTMVGSSNPLWSQTENGISNAKQYFEKPLDSNEVIPKNKVKITYDRETQSINEPLKDPSVRSKQEKRNLDDILIKSIKDILASLRGEADKCRFTSNAIEISTHILKQIIELMREYASKTPDTKLLREVFLDEARNITKSMDKNRPDPHTLSVENYHVKYRKHRQMIAEELLARMSQRYPHLKFTIILSLDQFRLKYYYDHGTKYIGYVFWPFDLYVSSHNDYNVIKLTYNETDSDVNMTLFWHHEKLQPVYLNSDNEDYLSKHLKTKSMSTIGQQIETNSILKNQNLCLIGIARSWHLLNNSPKLGIATNMKGVSIAKVEGNENLTSTYHYEHKFEQFSYPWNTAFIKKDFSETIYPELTYIFKSCEGDGPDTCDKILKEGLGFVNDLKKEYENFVTEIGNKVEVKRSFRFKMRAAGSEIHEGAILSKDEYA